MRILLTEVFLTDGLPAPGVDILLALDDYYAGRASYPVVEIGGRWAVSPRPSHSGEYAMDTFTDLAHGDFTVQDGQLTWQPGTVLHIECLPETVVDSLPEHQRADVHVLRRHGLDLASLHRSVAILKRELDVLRRAIDREQDRPTGLLPDTEEEQAAAGEPRWRLRSRQNAGNRRLIVHLDGCMAWPPPRILATSEVLDLAARGAHSCNRRGAAAAARDHAAPTELGAAVPHPQKPPTPRPAMTRSTPDRRTTPRPPTNSHRRGRARRASRFPEPTLASSARTTADVAALCADRPTQRRTHAG
ncbi:hypothetical protein ACIP6V_09740 [Streptomyces sp. NPDC088770]|uniref:hypothetical protein n=1 Tax=unclassified Streptomyces TaxID=2593676 RepID=UPI003822C958